MTNAISAFATAAALALTAPALAAPDGPLNFHGARLGMTLEAWRALPTPDGQATRTTAVCSEDPAALRSSTRTKDVQCVYRRNYGRFSLQPTIALPDGRRVTDIRYRFRDGRLTQIAYRLSVDSYEATVAQFDGRFGTAGRVVRDTVRTPDGRLSRVARTWTVPGGLVELVDPVAPYGQIEVRLLVRQLVTQAAVEPRP